MKQESCKSSHFWLCFVNVGPRTIYFFDDSDCVVRYAAGCVVVTGQYEERSKANSTNQIAATGSRAPWENSAQKG